MLCESRRETSDNEPQAHSRQSGCCANGSRSPNAEPARSSACTAKRSVSTPPPVSDEQAVIAVTETPGVLGPAAASMDKPHTNATTEDSNHDPTTRDDDVSRTARGQPVICEQVGGFDRVSCDEAGGSTSHDRRSNRPACRTRDGDGRRRETGQPLARARAIRLEKRITVS